MGIAAMDILCCRITIGDADPSNPMRIQNGVEITEVQSLEINESYKKLIGTAKVIFPKGSVCRSTIIGNVTLEGKDVSRITTEVMQDGVIIEKRSAQRLVDETTFKVGQRINIKLGYNGVLKNMFDGYITGYNSDSTLEIQCENMAYKLKLKQAPHFETPAKGTTVNEVLEGKYNILKDTGFRIHSDTKRFEIPYTGHAQRIPEWVVIHLITAFFFTEQQAASSRQVVCLCPDLHYLVIFPHYLFRRGGTDVDRLVHRSVIPGKEIDRVESIPVAVPVIFYPMHVQGLSRKGSETPLLHVRQAVIGVGICHRVLFQSIVLGNDVKLCMGIHHRAQEEGYNWNCFHTQSLFKFTGGIRERALSYLPEIENRYRDSPIPTARITPSQNRKVFGPSRFIQKLPPVLPGREYVHFQPQMTPTSHIRSRPATTR